MAIPKVYIILLNYNGYIDTIDCISSLKLLEYDNYEIVIVDNNSTDDSEIYISKFIKYNDKVHLINAEKNLGFSGGNNLGIKYALKHEADYICLLNNDTTVEPNFLSELVKEMELDSNIGICAGKILYYDNKNRIWSAGGYIDEIKSLGCHYGMDEYDNGKFDEKRQVNFLTGCVQLIRKDVLESVGFYDEDYFLYMEDVDFCYKTLNNGYKLMYIPNSKIYHKVSSSTGGDNSPLFLYYITRNRLLFAKKNYKDMVKLLKTYIFFIIKIFIDSLRKKKKYKYVLMGAKDFILNKRGYKSI